MELINGVIFYIILGLQIVTFLPTKIFKHKIKWQLSIPFITVLLYILYESYYLRPEVLVTVPIRVDLLLLHPAIIAGFIATTIRWILYNKNKPIKITTNGKISYNAIAKGKKIMINVDGKEYVCHNKPEKNHRIEGPIVHAFSDPFIVVGGTGGSSDERRIEDSEIQKFKKLWKTNYYGEFRYKNDLDITASDIKNSHLILIGNQRTNMFIKKIIKK